jgi:hydrogenase maturation protein HypF
MWQALLTDLQQDVPLPTIAARFHAGLADAVVGLAGCLATSHQVDSVALSGGVLQNKTLFQAVTRGLRTSGLQVLSHAQVPTNDGGLSLGQAVVAAARGL